MIRGWYLIIPGLGGTSTLTRRETPAARWLCEPHQNQKISNQPMGAGFSHLARRYRSGETAFSSPGCWRCRCIEGFMIRGGDRIVPGCGGTSPLTQRATLAARWLHESHPTINQPVGLGFPHLSRRYLPGGCPISSPGCSSCRCTEGILIRR